MQVTRPEDGRKFSSQLRRAAAYALDRAWPWLGYTLVQSNGRPLRVLHLGCGSGDVTTRVLAPRFPETVQVLGVDPDPVMVAYAAQHCQNPGVFYIQADISAHNIGETTLWKMRPFSQIFSFNYVQSLSPRSIPMNAISELLAPGGEALLTMIVFSHLYIVYSAMAKDSRWSPYMEDVSSHVSPYQGSEESYHEDIPNLTSIGLELLAWEVDGHAYSIFHSEEEFIAYLTAIDPFIQRMPEEERGKYKECLLNLCRGLCAVTASADGRNYELNFETLTVVLRKS